MDKELFLKEKLQNLKTFIIENVPLEEMEINSICYLIDSCILNPVQLLVILESISQKLCDIGDEVKLNEEKYIKFRDIFLNEEKKLDEEVETKLKRYLLMFIDVIYNK